MAKKAVLLCRAEDGNSEELSRQMKRLSSYAKESDWTVGKTYLLTGKLGGITLWDLRLKAKCREYDYLLIEKFDVFAMPPDECVEEVKFLQDNGVEIRTLSGEMLTCESLPTLFRSRLKLIRQRKCV